MAPRRPLGRPLASRTPRPSERERIPAPLIKRRIPSGRRASEQPNVTSDAVPLTPRFWLAIVVTGVAAGLFGVLMMLILFSMEHLAFGGHTGGFQAAVERSTALHRVAVLAVAGVFGGVAWYVLRRLTAGEKSDIDDAIWNGDGHLSFRRCLGSGAISEVVIGMGASIGRESAPKLLGGASASVISGWTRLSPAQRRLLVACGGGAGFAAVYNVPLGGALFTAEILIGSITLPVMLPAVACASIATFTSWIYLPQHATYLDIPHYRFSVALMVWGLIAGPLLGVAAVLYIRLVALISHHHVRGRWAPAAPLLAFTILGVIGIAYPQLFGNGKDMAHDAFLGVGSIALFAALAALKPLVTSLCLYSGASGGLFTPVMSTGAVLGGALGLAWSSAFPGSPVGAYAMVGGAAMIGAGMQAPLAALALILEFTHAGFGVMVPMMASTALATIVARHLDGYTIYSARLAAQPAASAPPAPEVRPAQARAG
ncbi:MAG TPA: chloride channel protein [Solirubrobacteraceae bacterium]|nr:chloride channel protein [Solirubrobacteraceae bacterium]